MQSTTLRVTRHGPDGCLETDDAIAVEEALELRLDGHPVAVLMRTPGDDKALAAGFLITEGIIASPDQLRKIETRPNENRVLVFLNDGVEVEIGKLTRHLYTGSSCGLCGKATLDAVFQNLTPITPQPMIADTILLESPHKLRTAQETFDRTGGLHAAGWFTPDGDLIVIKEDVGRHNAVDKVIGTALLDGIDLTKGFLLVSGRVSFEVMQKALAARIPLVAAISAPSSLAIDFARRSGQALVGFLRDQTFNRYA